MLESVTAQSVVLMRYVRRAVIDRTLPNDRRSCDGSGSSRHPICGTQPMPFRPLTSHAQRYLSGIVFTQVLSGQFELTNLVFPLESQADVVKTLQ